MSEALDNRAAFRQTAFHLGVWLGLSVALVLLRGVRWDENFEFAQLITGQVPYPAWHPLHVYLASAFSGQTHGMAQWLAWGAGEFLANGLHNTAYLLGTVWPAYLLGAYLGRSPWWGHAAAIAMLQGWLLEFDGTYPHNPWPWIYSNGHIGTAWAILSLYALARRHWFAAAWLASMMPVVHIGQSPVLGLLCAGCALHALRHEGPGFIPRALAGVALAAPFYVWLWWRMSQIPPAIAPPFDIDPAAVPDAIWRGMVFHVDPHRRLPNIVGVITLAGGLGLTVFGWRTETDAARRRAYATLALYAAGCTAIVLGTMAVHAALREDTPRMLLQWLPYRMLNHNAILLLVSGIGLASRTHAGRAAALALLLTAALRPFFQPLLGEAFYHRYLFAGDAFLYALFGVALSSGAQGFGKTSLVWLAAGVLPLAIVHQFGAACLLGGYVLTGMLHRCLVPADWQRAAVPAVLAIALLLLVRNEMAHRSHLERNAFEAAVLAELDAHAPAEAPIFLPPETYAEQAKIHHPVLIDACTSSHITYMPANGPLIQQIFEDVYGLRFDRDLKNPHWTEIWRDRTAEEWHALSAKFGGTHVLMYNNVELHLPVAVQGDDETLYRIP
ncbi:MAG: hypothetical protein GC168_08775 [Candidatus Hydrogenedens sp.]|nr:hypothetical protein [Candidatus Hydrogenedens sp.]